VLDMVHKGHMMTVRNTLAKKSTGVSELTPPRLKSGASARISGTPRKDGKCVVNSGSLKAARKVLIIGSTITVSTLSSA
jgi:hypothetical protein